MDSGMNRKDVFGRAVDFIKWRTLEAWAYVRFSARHDSREPNRVWEVHTLRRMFAHLPIDCVFDVGANLGDYAKMLRHDIGYRGLIVSFEPIPDLAVSLRRLSRNDPLWIIEEIALSDKDGTATFNVMENQEFSSLHDPSEKDTGEFQHFNKIATSITVRTERLESALLRLRRSHAFTNGFLKLDTQGNDAHIVASSQAALSDFVAFQSELSFVPIYSDSVPSDEALALYRSAGFVLSALIPNNAGHFPRLIECDCLMVRSDFVQP